MIPPHPGQAWKICFILHIKSHQQVLGAQQWITEKNPKVIMGLSRKEYTVNYGFNIFFGCAFLSHIIIRILLVYQTAFTTSQSLTIWKMNFYVRNFGMVFEML